MSNSEDWTRSGRRYSDDDRYVGMTDPPWSDDYDQRRHEQGGYEQGRYAEPDLWPDGGPSAGHLDNGWHSVSGWPESAGPAPAGEPRAASDPFGWPDRGYPDRGYEDPLGYRPVRGYDDRTGPDGYSSRPGGPGYGHESGPDSGAAFPGGDPYATGSFPHDGYLDTGSFGRPDTGSFGRPDTGSFGRPDTGSFEPADTGSFGWSDVRGGLAPGGREQAGRYEGLDDYDDYPSQNGYRDDVGYDDPLAGVRDPRGGPARWPAPAGEAGTGGSTRTASAPGHEPWQDDLPEHDDWDDDEPDDEDWDDDGADDGGLLARRFGGGGGDGEDGGGRGRGRGRRPRRARRRVITLALFLVVVLVAGVGISAAVESVHNWIMNRYGDYTGSGTGKVTVVVHQGDSLMSLGPALVSDQVIMAVRPYDSAANSVSNASALQPGTYVLHYHMNAALAVKLLLSGKTRVADSITIPEGWRASRIIATLAKKTGDPVSAFEKIIKNPPASLGLPSYAGGKVEGYLFPDTYTLQPKEKPLQILKAMVAEFKIKAGGVNLVAEARKVNLTPAQVITIASLVQAEGNGQDFGKISRVIDNRLNQGMKLGFDSTVFYALNTYGTSATTKQTQVNSPYNTYLHTGLPPGPIDSPGLAAIKAALHPPHGNWLYFITVNLKTGQTDFTSSYAQFQQWQAQAQG